MKSSIWCVLANSALLLTGGCSAVVASKTSASVGASPASVGASPASVGASPASVGASPASVELGRIAQGATKEVIVHLTNRGTSPVHISNISTSCGCTTSQIGNEVLQPGQSVALKVKYNSVGFSGPEEKFVTVNFADNQPALDIAVRANVYPLLKVSPPNVDFGTLSVGVIKTKTVVVERLDGGALPLPRFANTKELEIQATHQSTSRAILHFRMQPSAFAGARQSVLQLQTGLSALPQISVPVRASVVGRYLITPHEMNFGVVKGQAVRQVIISDAHSKPFHKLEIVSVPKGCSATLSEKAGKSVLSLKCKSDSNGKIINEAVILKTGIFPETLVRIPVLAVLNAA